MDDERKLSEQEYFQALLGDSLGATALKLRIFTFWSGLVCMAIAAIAFLFVLPSTYGPLLPPTSFLNVLPFYFRQYSQLNNAVLGAQIWWVMAIGICFLAVITISILIWLTIILIRNKRAQIGFKGVPVLNPPVMGAAISSFPVFSLLLTDLWEPLILGGYKVEFGPGILFLVFWCLGFILAIFLVWHVCIFVCLLVMRFISSKKHIQD